jgi:hypothetical protein
MFSIFRKYFAYWTVTELTRNGIIAKDYGIWQTSGPWNNHDLIGWRTDDFGKRLQLRSHAQFQ